MDGPSSTAELASASAVKTPRTARTTATAKTEPVLVNVLGNEDNNTTALSDLPLPSSGNTRSL